MTAKQIIEGVLDDHAELPMDLATHLAVMGDPFHEDNRLLVEKYKLIWSHIRTQMRKIWKQAGEEARLVVDNDMENSEFWKLRQGEEYQKKREEALEKATRENFINLSYGLMHVLVEKAGLPSLGDTDYSVFRDIVEIMQDDVHDFWGLLRP
jgi:hypothetical protein